MRRFIGSFLTMLVWASTTVSAQLENWNVVSPLKTKTTLSGSFAELRRNHFHGGLDFRTPMGENTPIYAIDKGYVSRITISARSYGKLAYITHPNGYTTLYAHLNGFVPKLDSIVKSKQYAKQSYEIDFTLEPNEYPVNKGDLFALSGNTGASAGPHLHFEIRTTEGHYMQNPLKLNKDFQFEDNKNPRIFAVKLYGLNGGSVNGSKERRYTSVLVKGKGRKLQAANNIKAWGEIGFGVKANDYMTGTSFTHTPRHLKVYADGNIISDITIDNYKFSDTRALNNFIDFRHQAKTGEFFMRSFKDKNNPLDFNHGTSGTLNINEERDYNIKYEVIDDFGNSDSILFTIKGEQHDPIIEAPKEGDMIQAGQGTFYDKGDFLFHFPANALYSDLYTEYKKKANNRYHSSIHTIGNWENPLHTYCDLSIKVEKDSASLDISKLFIAKLNENDLIIGSAGGKYTNGFMVGMTNTLGKFAVAEDKTPPVISAIHTKGLRGYPVLVFKISDGLSGIASYDGYIDDEWVLFEHDAKTHTIRYHIDTKKFQKNKSHTFKLVVKDYCGNATSYSKIIFL
ncbi:MAG: M23 family metallopeptidase [Paludibacteraceae bacterium]|nr:M23 family metallopeptidase [Paludibacteraceae bacterium]